MDAVIAASLDVDSVAAEIDYEREQTVELRSSLRYKRDRAIGSTNVAVLAAVRVYIFIACGQSPSVQKRSP
jgi:hypothetical protein